MGCTNDTVINISFVDLLVCGPLIAYCGLVLRKCAHDRIKMHVAGGRRQMMQVLVEEEEELNM
jgi:hypothetical protein